MIRGREPFPPGWWAAALTAPKASVLRCEEGEVVVVVVVAASLPLGSGAAVPAVDPGTPVAVEGWAPAAGVGADPPTAAAARPEVGDAWEPGEATTAGCWVAATVVGVTGAAVVGVEVRASGQMAA
jgi:hypothetical protein